MLRQRVKREQERKENGRDKSGGKIKTVWLKA